MIKKRNALVFYLLTILTCGIYYIVVCCLMGRDINKICEGDGKKQMHYLLALLLGCVTLGIFTLIWFKKGMDRLCDNGYRYNVTVGHTGSEYIMWSVFGFLLAGVGGIVAMVYYIGDINQFADSYGVVPTLKYTDNMAERAMLSNQAMFNMMQQPVQVNVNQQYPNAPAPAIAPAVRNNGQIVCVRGTYNGAEVPIANETVVTIGGDPACCNFVLDNSFTKISGKHVSIKFHGNTNCYDVTDYSSNGTFLSNGTRLNRNVTANYPVGTEIYLADGENAFKLN